MKYRLALLMFFAYGMSAFATISQVETKQPVQLFEEADVNSNQATIPAGQQLVIFNANSDLLPAGLVASDGKLLLAGYISNRDVSSKSQCRLCGKGAPELNRAQIAAVKRIERYFRARYRAAFPGRPMDVGYKSSGYFCAGKPNWTPTGVPGCYCVDGQPYWPL